MSTDDATTSDTPRGGTQSQGTRGPAMNDRTGAGATSLDARSGAREGETREAHGAARSQHTGHHDSGAGTGSGVHPNAARLQDRRSSAEEGRPVRITVNQSFAQEVGPAGQRAYVDVLGRTSQTEQGRGVDEVRDRLLEGWKNAGISVDPMEARQIAEQVNDPTRGPLTVVDHEGNVLFGPRLDDGEGGAPSARQDEPEDSDRPLYS